MLREVIGSAISTASDMAIVGTIDDGESLTASLDRADADVLIIGTADEAAARALEPLLYERPRLTLLTVANDGRSTTVHALRPYRGVLSDVSPLGLIDAIRVSARASAR